MYGSKGSYGKQLKKDNIKISDYAFPIYSGTCAFCKITRDSNLDIVLPAKNVRTPFTGFESNFDVSIMTKQQNATCCLATTCTIICVTFIIIMYSDHEICFHIYQISLTYNTYINLKLIIL